MKKSRLTSAQIEALAAIKTRTVRAFHEEGNSLLKWNWYRPTMEILLRRGLIELESSHYGTVTEGVFYARLTEAGEAALEAAGGIE